jgi:Flp pilus assembly protein TadG
VFRRFERDERGTGVVGTAFGAAVFIAFLLLATHTLLSLYASSVISATAWDAARLAADSRASDSQVAAEAKARNRLHGFENVSVDVRQDENGVTVHIQADRPMFLPAALAKSSGLQRFDKTVHARTETWR